MFTQSDVKDITLERLIAYINLHNKEEIGVRKQDNQQEFNQLTDIIDQASNINGTNSGSMDKLTRKQSESQKWLQKDQIYQKKDSQKVIQTQMVPIQASTTSLRFIQPQVCVAVPQLRSAINMKSLMLALKNHTIDYLKQQFILNNNIITIEKFLFLMKQCIQYQKDREYQIFYQLIKLFEEIDIDGNKSIDWNQFLEYLACYGWATKDSLSQKKAHIKLIDSHFKQHMTYRKQPLNKIIQIQRLQMVCLVQKKSFQLSHLNLNGHPYSLSSQSQQKLSHSQLQHANSTNKPKLLFSINHIDMKKVLSFDYSEDQRLFGILQTDRKVRYVEEGEIQKTWGLVEGNGNQIEIGYLKIHQKWYLLSIDGVLDIFSSPKQKNNNQKISFKPHEKSITSIRQLKHPQSLITSSLDSKIKIWSLSSKQLLIQLRPTNEQQVQCRTKGIKGLDVLNLGSSSYFSTWTFTSEIMIWLPSSSVSKPYIGKLTGHSGIVESSQFMKFNQILISIDNRKVVKLWNVQTMECIQSITHEGDGCRVKTLNSKCYFLIYDRLITYYTLKKSAIAMLGMKKVSKQRSSTLDKKPLQETLKNILSARPFNRPNPKQQVSTLLGVQFCSYNVLLLFLFQHELRVFNINTGKVQAIFQPYFKDQEEFVAMCIKINRRVFIVSTFGYVYYVKIDDGELIKRFSFDLSSFADINSTRNETHNPTDNSKLNKNSKSTLKTNQNTNKKYKNQALTQKRVPMQNQKVAFRTKFIYYHTIAGVLLIVVETDQNCSIILTFSQKQGYEFEKMKQIQFGQTQLKKLLFFKKLDLFIIVSDDIVSIWDFQKMYIVNKISLKDQHSQSNFEPQLISKHTIQGEKQKQQNHTGQKDQHFMKSVFIDELNKNNSYFIMILTNNQKLRVYQIRLDASIKTILEIVIPHNIHGSVNSIWMECTKDQEIQSLFNIKVIYSLFLGTFIYHVRLGRKRIIKKNMMVSKKSKLDSMLLSKATQMIKNHQNNKVAYKKARKGCKTEVGSYQIVKRFS